MRNFTRQLRGLNALYSALLLAVCGLSVLSAVSCQTQRTVERQTIRADTLRQGSTESVTVVTATEAVSGDSVRLTVPMTVIQSLPDGAAFTKKEGRTRLSLQRDGDAVTAVAETDSMMRETSRYERRARDSLQHTGSTAMSEQRVKEKPPNTILVYLLLTAVVAVFCIIGIKTTFK